MQRRSQKIYSEKRKTLMQDARKGVEAAIESLSMQDMGLYNTICKKIMESDVYSLVDTTFIPCGVESDHYAILGEILHVKEETNMYYDDMNYITSYMPSKAFNNLMNQFSYMLPLKNIVLCVLAFNFINI